MTSAVARQQRHQERLMDLAVLVERDLSYQRRFRRRRTFSPESTQVQSEVRSEDREKVLSWLLEAFTEQSWPLEAFCLTVQIMDKFLEVCCHIQRSQLQVSGEFGEKTAKNNAQFCSSWPSFAPTSRESPPGLPVTGPGSESFAFTPTTR